jgi:predicted GH43/DUF377 family glycosyl hydrolase
MFVVKRSAQNPIISPTRASSWETLAAFNPSAVAIGGTTHIFYRALSRPDVFITPYAGLSTIGYAQMTSDVPPEKRTQVIMPEYSWEHFGCEDPRATFFEGKWYVFYTALGGFPFGPDNIKVAVAVGDSPTTLTEKHLVTPFNAKAATLFPERINGEAVLLLTAHTDFTEEHPRPTIAIARAKRVENFFDPSYWEQWHKNLADHALPDVRRNDQEHMEVGAAPIKTLYGWLLVYSHIQNYYDEPNRIFGIEALLLDLKDPTKIIARTEGAFLVPEESYEHYGIVPNIAFPSGATLEGDVLSVYYGAADTSSAVARLSFTDLREAMMPEKRAELVKRVSSEPIMSPIPEHTWESVSVSNAAAIDAGGSVHLLYRAMGPDNTSTMGYARLADGIHIDERLPNPVYVPREQYEMKIEGNSGCEDPRLTVIDDTAYLCYTAYDGIHNTRGALATIPVADFVAHKFNWSAPKLLTPEGVNDKDLCIFEGPGDKVTLIHRIDPNICIDQFDDAKFSRESNRCIELMTPRKGMWDSVKIGAAGAPIKVEEGWLFIYHGIGEDKFYRLGAALLDAETGSVVLARTAAPILEPELPWEKEGVVNNVVFSCGAIIRDDTIFLYYGGADKSIGVATISKKALMKKLLPAI